MFAACSPASWQSTAPPALPAVCLALVNTLATFEMRRKLIKAIRWRECWRELIVAGNIAYLIIRMAFSFLIHWIAAPGTVSQHKRWLSGRATTRRQNELYNTKWAKVISHLSLPPGPLSRPLDRMYNLDLAAGWSVTKYHREPGNLPRFNISWDRPDWSGQKNRSLVRTTQSPNKRLTWWMESFIFIKDVWASERKPTSPGFIQIKTSPYYVHLLS